MKLILNEYEEPFYEFIRREGIVLTEGKKIRLGSGKMPMLNFLIKEFKAFQLRKSTVFQGGKNLYHIKRIFEFLIGPKIFNIRYLQHKFLETINYNLYILVLQK